jgi:hypothetical protein
MLTKALTRTGTVTNAAINVPVTCAYLTTKISGVIMNYSSGSVSPTASNCATVTAGSSCSVALTITGQDSTGTPVSEDVLTVSTSGNLGFIFSTTASFKAGGPYSVTIKNQPVYPTGTNVVQKYCEVLNGSGKIPADAESVSNLSNVIVSCRIADAANTYAYAVTADTTNGGGVLIPFTFNSAGVPTKQAAVTPTTKGFVNPTQVYINPWNNAVGWVVDGGGSGTVTGQVLGARVITLTNRAVPTVAGTAASGTLAGAYAMTVAPKDAMSGMITSTSQNKICVYSVNATNGALTVTTSTANGLSSGCLTVTGSAPRGITYHPSSKYIYVVNSGTNTVGAYTASGNPIAFGALNTLNTTTNLVSTGTTPYNIAIEPSGNYAYVTNSGDGTVSMYNICQVTHLDGVLPCTGGTLSSLGTVLVEASNSNPIQISADKTTVYVVSGTGKVYQFAIQSDGTLVARTPAYVDPGSGVTGIATFYSVDITGATTFPLSGGAYVIKSQALLYNSLTASGLGSAFSSPIDTLIPGASAIGIFR